MPPKKTSDETPKATRKPNWTEEEKNAAVAEARRINEELKKEGKEGKVSWLSVLSEMRRQAKTAAGEEVSPVTKKEKSECAGRKPKTACEEVEGCKWVTMKSGKEYCAKRVSSTRKLSPGRVHAAKQSTQSAQSTQRQQRSQNDQAIDY